MINKKNEITFEEAIIFAEKYLEQKNIKSAKLNAELLLQFVCQISAIDLKMKKNEIISPQKFEHFYNLIEQRATNKPLQYILGYVDFYNVQIKINENVLIPRPETEQLIDIIKNENIASKFVPETVLDICSGSGCISFALSKLYPNSKIDAIEISKNAIELALENREFLNISNVNFINCDLKKYDFGNKKYDLIVCNPPYISTVDYKKLEPELFFEPKIALTDDEDGLSFYKFLSEKLNFILNENGKIFFECGNNQAEIISNIFKKNNYSVNIFNDFSNIPRFLLVKK